MMTKDSIETAYSFLHQKQRIYVHSTLDWQKDDIEMAIASSINTFKRTSPRLWRCWKRCCNIKGPRLAEMQIGGLE